jgi:Domain of unknown function (DUF4136)
MRLLLESNFTLSIYLITVKMKVMKYSFIKSVLVTATAALAFTACNVTGHTEKAVGINFSNYKTFGWANNNAKKVDRLDNDIIDNNIKNSISRELEKKGWKEADTAPDVLIDYNIAVEKGTKRESSPVYSYPYTQYLYGRRRIYTIWYPSMLMGYHSYNVPFKEGQLTVNMVDAKTNKLIWQGWAKGEINSSNISTKEATAEVKSIFKKFEYPG